MESYGGGDEKWKLSKKGRSRSGRAQQHSNTTMDAGDMLSRSYSASVSGTRREAHHHHHQASAAAASQQGTNQAGAAGLSKKCVEAVKEHRARFYIVRRCVSMLVCWRDH